MNGHVDDHGRALVTVSIRPSDVAAAHDFEVWIDTGFTGDLVLSQERIDELELPLTGSVKAILADGSEVVLKRYSCLIEWFGEERELELVSNAGDYPLLGVGLLLGRELHVGYRSRRVVID